MSNQSFFGVQQPANHVMEPGSGAQNVGSKRAAHFAHALDQVIFQQILCVFSGISNRSVYNNSKCLSAGTNKVQFRFTKPHLNLHFKNSCNEHNVIGACFCGCELLSCVGS